MTACAFTLSLFLIGCDHEVSKDESTKVSGDGTVKTKEKTVTESKDGKVTKKEETTKTAPTNSP